MLDESSHSSTKMPFESLLTEVFLADESKKDIAYNAIVDYINKNHCKYYEQCKVIDENLLEISTKCAYKQYDDDADEPLFDIDGCNKDLKNRFGITLFIDYDDLSQYSDNVVSPFCDLRYLFNFSVRHTQKALAWFQLTPTTG